MTPSLCSWYCVMKQPNKYRHLKMLPCKNNDKVMIQLKQQSPDLNIQGTLLQLKKKKNSLSLYKSPSKLCALIRTLPFLDTACPYPTPQDQFGTTPKIIIWSFKKNSMAQGPSWETSGCSASQAMYYLLSGKFKIVYSIYGYKPRRSWSWILLYLQPCWTIFSTVIAV